jgi:precorrin-4/cobalt-precorrin-4 C11-methyltransferase
MTVHFIGAGPGAPDLITLRGRDLLAACPVCLYAGSLVPEALLAHCPATAMKIDTASLTLDEIMALIAEQDAAGHDIARLHSGDPSLYGAIGEQIRRLNALGIAYDITPGVPAYAAAAASLGIELTLPAVSQSLVLTRTAMKASAMPNAETLEVFAQSGATLAIHLSVRNARAVAQALIPHYGKDCPTVVAFRVGWEDEAFLHCRLEDLQATIRQSGRTRTGLILVGRVLDTDDFTDSALYDAAHAHLLRPGPKSSAKSGIRSGTKASPSATRKQQHKGQQ